MMKLIPLTMLSISMSLILTPSPLMLGLFIFMLALVVSITMSILSSWMAMVIFLIYVGGLLVLFAYFLAIQPNHFMGVATLTLFTMLSVMFLESTFMVTTHWTSFTNFISAIPFIMHISNMPTMLLLAALLLLILVIVVKITSSKSGPLRPFL